VVTGYGQGKGQKSRLMVRNNYFIKNPLMSAAWQFELADWHFEIEWRFLTELKNINEWWKILWIFFNVIKNKSKCFQYYKRTLFVSYNHDCVISCLKFKKVIVIEN